MSPWLKYLLGRIGLFLGVLLVLLPLPLSLPVQLLAALVVSFALSWFLLRGWRDAASAHMAAAVEQRRAEKQRLRAALAGDDDATEPGDDSPR